MFTRSIVLLSGLAALGACQSYQPRPLNPEAHRAAFESRGVQSEEILEFAARVAARSGQPAAYNPDDGISLAEAELVALVFNPQLRAARASARITQVGVENAGRWDDPVISLDVLRIIQSVPSPWVIATSVGFSIPISGRLAVEKQEASAEHQASLAAVAKLEWELLAELRQRWIEWSAAQWRVELSNETLARVNELAAIVNRLEQAGELAPIEARLFRIEAATRANEGRILQQRAAELELQLKAIMGLTPNAAFAMQRELSLPDAGEFDLQNAELESTNPALRLRRAEYEVAEHQLHLEIRKQYPDLNLGPTFEQDQSQSRIGFLGAIPLPILNGNRRGIAEAEAAREAARVAFESEYERLINEIAQAQVRSTSQREIRADLQAHLIPLVDAQLRDAQRMAQLGELNTLIQLETLVRVHDAKLRLIDAFAAEASAGYSLRTLIGPDQTTPEPSLQGAAK